MTATLAGPPSCTVCGAAARRDPYYYEWQGTRYQLLRCPTCTHSFVHPPIAPADQETIYADHYFTQNGDWSCGVWQLDYKGADAKLRDEARSILEMLPRPPGRLLDVGCAGGIFLDEARLRGFTVTGIELNASMARHARINYELDVLNARIEDVAVWTWHQQFDVIVLLDCLEHIPAPGAAILKAAHWLAPDGRLFIRGPLNNRRLDWLKATMRRSLGLTKHLPGYPLDANSFTKRSLSVLTGQHGLTVTHWINERPGFANLLCHRGCSISS
jgi:2-polyprenyl-3-methyl-5-hydroxy-6-metoxy-1,4-benzoquinol methylase